LEATHGERLDTLSPASQAKKIRNLLTVAEIDRTEVA